MALSTFLVLIVGDLVGIPLPRQLDDDGEFVAAMRNALVQSFRHLRTGDTFAVSANHFKSKGSECYEDLNNPSDQDAVQSSCNALRVSASVALSEALLSMDLPEKLVILGDLNCYTSEDPMAVLTSFEPEVREYVSYLAFASYGIPLLFWMRHFRFLAQKRFPPCLPNIYTMGTPAAMEHVLVRHTAN